MTTDTYLESLIEEAKELTLQLAAVQARIWAHTLMVEGEFGAPHEGEADEAAVLVEA